MLPGCVALACVLKKLGSLCHHCDCDTENYAKAAGGAISDRVGFSG